MIDRRPDAIVRCADATDVMTAVNFARNEDVVVAVRGGGHNGAGLGVCDRGLVIDLSSMKGVLVNPNNFFRINQNIPPRLALIIVLNPNVSTEMVEVERLNERLVRRALSLDGTCTGEHGVGCHSLADSRGEYSFISCHRSRVPVLRALRVSVVKSPFANSSFPSPRLTPA
jgi:FAD/FMN-containing dehydrogenase